MRRRIVTLTGLAAVLAATLLWLVAAPSVSAGDPCYHDYQMPASTTSSATTVMLESCAFAATVTNVPVGATLRFTNSSPFNHLITGANQGWGSRDTEIAPGASVTYAFKTAGIYPYACALHRGMSGVIVVGDAGAISAATVGSTSATTGSTTTIPAATTPVPAPTQAAATADPLPLVVLAVFVGLLIGGIGGWLVSRRRSMRGGTTVAPVG